MQGPWEKYGGTAAQQAPPGVIMGRPKAPLPVSPHTLEQDNIQNANVEGDNTRQTQGQVQDYRKEFFNSQPVKAYQIAIQSLSNSLKRGDDGSGDVALIYDYAKALDPESVVRESEATMAQSGQSAIESAVTRYKKEFGIEGGGVLDPRTRARLRREIYNATTGRVAAYNQQREYFTGIAKRSNYAPEDVVGPHLGEPYLAELRNFDTQGNRVDPAAAAARKAGADYRPEPGDIAFNIDLPGSATSDSPVPRIPADKEAALSAYLQARSGDSNFRAEEYQAFARSLGVEGAFDLDPKLVEAVQKGHPLPTGVDYSRADEERRAEAEAELRSRGHNAVGRAESGEAGVQKGVLLNLSDEIAGVAGGVGSFVKGDSFRSGYERERDVERAAQRISREANGITPEIVGGLLTPASALSRAKTVGQFAKQGAALGAVSGFGEGEGAQNSLLSAGGGAAAGGVLGAGIAKAGQGVNALLQSPTGQRIVGAAAKARGQVNREVVEAGERQSIPIRQPDARPELRNQMAVVEASPSQGERVRQTLDADQAAVQSRLADVGGDGTRLDNFSMGERVQGAGQRYIVKSRDQADALYRRAEDAANGAKVRPQQALKAIDDNIAELKANGERGNAGQIRYLEDLKADLSRGELTIDQLRSIRSNARGQINERNLTATDADRRVGDVLRAASSDIERGLEGNPKALGAYKSADEFYREKQTFIKDVVQRFTGSRSSPLSAEQAASKFQAMMRDKGDYKRFSEMVKRLDPDERGDMAASIAENLGLARNGEFSLAALSTNVSKMNPRALRDLFGEDGAKALADLRVIARAKADTARGLNTSKSGVVMAANNQFKDLLLGVFGGGVGGVPGAMGGMAARGAMERFSSARAARLLLNPDFTKWLRQTPSSTSSAVIDRHFDRLNKLAAREQTFLMDAKALQDYLRNAISQTPSRAAAEGQQEQDRR